MEEPTQFLTEAGVNVTSLINQGKTEKFTCRNEAYKHARETGSYVYNLNCYVDHKKERIVKPFGYAVPK